MGSDKFSFLERHRVLIVSTVITLAVGAIGTILLDYQAMQIRIQGIAESDKVITEYVIDNRDRIEEIRNEIKIIDTRMLQYIDCIRYYCIRTGTVLQKP